MSSAPSIQVSGMGGISYTVSRAATALQESGQVILCAINSGIPNVVQAAELLKHKIKGLHQINVLERVAESNKTRVSITLSLKQLDSTSKGYQAPIPEAEVQVASFDELKTRPQRAPREERKTSSAPREERKSAAPAAQTGTSDRPPAAREGRGGRRNRRSRRGRAGREPRESREPREPKAPRSGGPAAQANKYKKVRPPKASEPPAVVPGELHISPKRPSKYYVKDAVLWFKKEAKDFIILRASGWAIGHAVATAEDIKRAIKGLHQIAAYSKRTVVDEYESTEAGLSNITKERTIPALEIRLSIRPVDASDPGYQAPVPDSLVKEMTVAEAEAIA